MAAGPATARGLPPAARFSGSKYRIDLKAVVKSRSISNFASSTAPPGAATAIALLVVPKSNPTARIMSFIESRKFSRG